MKVVAKGGDLACHLSGMLVERGMTQYELARAADISPNHLNSIINMRTVPGLWTAIKIAAALSTGVEDIWEAK